MCVLDHTNATHADGAALMAWLERHGRVGSRDATTRRRLQRWRAGAQASFALVDALLVEEGQTVADVPAHVWRPYDNGRTGLRDRRAA
jgi:hypothetical protein